MISSQNYWGKKNDEHYVWACASVCVLYILLCCLAKVCSGPGVKVVSGPGSWNQLTFCFLGVSRYNVQDKDTFFDNATRSRIVSTQVNQGWRAVEGKGRLAFPCSPCYLPLSFAWGCLATKRPVPELPSLPWERHSRQLPSPTGWEKCLLFKILHLGLSWNHKKRKCYSWWELSAIRWFPASLAL